jgi:hypothetical protein
MKQAELEIKSPHGWKPPATPSPQEILARERLTRKDAEPPVSLSLKLSDCTFGCVGILQHIVRATSLKREVDNAQV